MSISRYFRQFGLMTVAVAAIAVQGTAAPKDISSFEQLCLIGVDAGYPLNGEYRLVGDIDASGSRNSNGGAGFLPIGWRKVLVPATMSTPAVIDSSEAFTGTFDGGGYTISGLYIRRAAAAETKGSGMNVGLFGFTFGAAIRNVTVAADMVAGYSGVGALVGSQSGGSVERCVAAGAVTGQANVGGLVGMLEDEGTVRLSYSSANVGGESVNTVGGFAGLNDGVISESYSIGRVTVAGGDNVGGFAGSLTNRAKVVSCYSAAAVSGGSAASVGGLAGNVDDGGEVRQSYSAGAVSGGDAVGGLIGTGGGAAARFSFWDTERSGVETSAGGSLGAIGRSTAQMMSVSDMNNLLTAAEWGISNNYPYLENEFFPKRTLTVTAATGGALSGAAYGTAHTQTVNHWIAGNTVKASAARLPVHPDSPDSAVVVESFDGWYLAGSDEKLAPGRYDDRLFTVKKASAEGTDGEFSVSDLTAAAAVEIEARFILKKYTLRYVAKNGSGSIASQDGNPGTLNSAADTLVKLVEYGAVSSVTAVPKLGYKFVAWSWRDDAGAPKRSQDPLRTDTVLCDSVFVANFADSADTVRLIYTAGGDNGRLLVSGRSGTVKSDTTYRQVGENGPAITAIPIDPAVHRFVEWSDGVKTNPRIDSTVVDSIDVVAFFDTIPVSVKSHDRTIPALTYETARIQPAKAVSAALTAGPNPISRQSGKVNLYWQSSEITKGTLRIFDASGNLVNKIIISNNKGINNPVAAWTLTNAKGIPVSAGTYLIKGTLSTKNGKREKVTLVLSLI